MGDAKVIWKSNLQFEGSAKSGFSIPLDTSLAEGGGKGFSPMELLLVGLAGCTGMDVISILRKKRQEVTHFEVVVNGARAADYPKVYTDIEIVYKVAGRHIDQASLERAIQLSEERYCPAMAMLRKAANITNRYEIEQE